MWRLGPAGTNGPLDPKDYWATATARAHISASFMLPSLYAPKRGKSSGTLASIPSIPLGVRRARGGVQEYATVPFGADPRLQCLTLAHRLPHAVPFGELLSHSRDRVSHASGTAQQHRPDGMPPLRLDHESNPCSARWGRRVSDGSLPAHVVP